MTRTSRILRLPRSAGGITSAAKAVFLSLSYGTPEGVPLQNKALESLA
jgi:hypothetical protein